MLTDDQKRIRKTGITSTDAVKIMSGHIAQVYLDKTAAEIEPDTDDETARAGRYAEKMIADMWIENQTYGLSEVGTVTHTTQTWMIATPDRIVYRSSEADLPASLAHLCEDFAVAEIKNLTPMSPHRYKYNEDDAALKDIVQCLWHCAVTGLQEFFILALFDGWRIKEYHYVIDDELRDLQNKIIEKCRRVWHEIIVPRRWDLIETEPHDEFVDLINREAPAQDGKVLIANDDSIMSLVSGWLEMSAEVAQMNIKIACAENEIKRLMGENIAMVDAEGKTIATWKPNRNGSRVFRRVAVNRERKDEL